MKAPKTAERFLHAKALTCPVLNLMATRDDLVPCSQSLPFNDPIGSTVRADFGDSRDINHGYQLTVFQNTRGSWS